MYSLKVKKSYFSILVLMGLLALYSVHLYDLNSVTFQVSDNNEDNGEALGYGSIYPEIINDTDEDFQHSNGILQREPAALKKPFGRVTSRKGRRRPPKRGASSNHKGIDYAMPCGTPVSARQSGRVTKAGWARGYGKTVAISTGRCRSIYAHLSRISVRVGQKVNAGAIIARSGNTGVSTGCHLHYESCSQLYAQLTPNEQEQQVPKDGKGGLDTPAVAGFDFMLMGE